MESPKPCLQLHWVMRAEYPTPLDNNGNFPCSHKSQKETIRMKDGDSRVEEQVTVATLDAMMEKGASCIISGRGGCANETDDTIKILTLEEEEDQPDSLLTLAQTEMEDAATDASSLFSPADDSRLNTPPDLLITTDDVILVMDYDDQEEEEEEEAIAAGRVIDSSTAHAFNHHHHPWGASAQQQRQRAEFVSATVIKRTADDMLGIAFAGRNNGNRNNDMRIVALHQNGLLHASPLRVGDQLLSICSKSCLEQLDTRTAGALLRQAQGMVSIVARNDATGSNSRLVETMVEKADPASPVGIAFRRNTHGSLEVSKVIASGLFAHSLLNVGDRVISINSVPCRQGLSAQEAVDLCRASCRFVTILTESQGLTGVVVAAAEQGEELGGLHADAAALPVVAPPTTPKGVIVGENWERFHRHPCYCIWMITISMSIIAFVVFDPFKWR
jgi:hypothetical protein